MAFLLAEVGFGKKAVEPVLGGGDFWRTPISGKQEGSLTANSKPTSIYWCGLVGVFQFPLFMLAIEIAHQRRGNFLLVHQTGRPGPGSGFQMW